jgi:hypothetical protein
VKVTPLVQGVLAKNAGMCAPPFHLSDVTSVVLPRMKCQAWGKVLEQKHRLIVKLLASRYNGLSKMAEYLE